MSDLWILLSAWVFGLVFGSFYNVLIYRIPKGISFSKGRSACPSCDTQLGAVDLVPLFSYLFLRGRCRHCGAPISLRYPLVELATGFLFMLAFLAGNNLIEAIHWSLFFSMLLITAMIDFDTHEIYDGVLVFFSLPGLLTALFTQGLQKSLWGVIVAGGLYLLIYLVAHLYYGEEAFGMGDVLFMASMGLFLGYPRALVAALGAFYLALLLLLLPRLRGKHFNKKTPTPFAPAMALAGFLSVFFAQDLLFWYQRTFLG